MLILRGTVTVFILMIESTHLTASWLSTLSVVEMGLAIFIGFGLFTSLSSALTAILIVASTFMSHSELMIRSTLAALSFAIALMGGGAYSIDGLLHGRRRIVLPKT